MAGTLYVVSTPIGNLEDITLRALRVLGEVSLIAAEDTRHTRGLLEHFQIRTPTLSYHDFSAPGRAEAILQRLSAGEDVALVSDAGTPGISDPGYELIRAAIEAQVPVVPIPGASAVLAALSVSGLPMNAFVFEGFLPRRGAARRETIQRIARESRTTVMFEAPHRLSAALRDLAAELGPRPVALAREITKRFEEIWRGDLVSAAAHWREGARGEIVLVIGAAPAVAAQDTLLIEGDEERTDLPVGADTARASGPHQPVGLAGAAADSGSETAALLDWLQARVAGGVSRRDAAREAAGRFHRPYRTLYRLALQLESPGEVGE